MKRTMIIICVFLGLLGAAWGIWQSGQDRFVTIDSVRYSRDITELDLSGKPVADWDKLAQLSNLTRLDLRGCHIAPDQFSRLRQALPQCQILWELPFQGKFYPLDTRQITISSLDQSDIMLLDYLSQLETVDAAACRDYEALQILRQRRPECQVLYQVEIGGKFWPQDTTQITIPGASPDSLQQAAALLPELTTICLTEVVTDCQALYSFLQSNPQLECHWRFQLHGVTVSNRDTEIDLSGIPLENTQELEYALRYFTGLEKVILCDCGISNEEMAALRSRNPHIQFVWTVDIGPIRLRTDAQYFMPYQYGWDVTNADCANLIYCTELICVDFGHMPISKIDFLKNCTKMKYLLLGDTRVSDLSVCANMPDLIFAELFLTRVKDLSPLVCCGKLEDLNIGHTNISDVAPLCQMPWLKNLWAKTSHLSRQEQQQVIAALPNTVINFNEGDSSTDEGWRRLQNYYDMRDLLGMPYFTG